jgi:PII-like signaling protein
MKMNEDAVLLRIFIGESDMYHGKPLYEQIVLKARELKLAGATVVRGIMGFGADSHLHSAKILRLSEDLPIIIEIVDTEENINRILSFLDEVVKEGLVTVERVRAVLYRRSKN